MNLFNELVICIALAAAAAAQFTKDAEVVSSAITEFAVDLFQVLSKASPGKNFIYSPLSAHAVLSMVYQGSANTTESALSTALHVKSKTQAADGYRSIMENLNDQDKEAVEVSIANKLYLQEGLKFKPEFETVSREKFRSEVENIDFGNNEEAAGTINGWVEEKTAGKIKDLVSADSFKEETHSVLVNTLYFKGQWYMPFEDAYTTKKPFYVAEDKSVDVDTMVNMGSFFMNDIEDLDALVLDLPFENENYSMLILLPNKKDGLADLESKLPGLDLKSLGDKLSYQLAVLRMPKFKIEHTIDLKEALSQMGLEILFDQDNCNLTDMIQDDDVIIDEAIQKVFIDVNEKGCEAAAASEIKSVPRSLPQRLNVDHPFLFTIVKKTETAVTMLFAGRIINPVEG